jgi:hypothetical protein
LSGVVKKATRNSEAMKRNVSVRMNASGDDRRR